ncbi:uncharacterized protein LOC132870765 [Neoarius graeffei]|uniref:uncharacterized protein LOC132870765 n=1 Tax=Neoarius graeffei TaxID=443677 RepID=UPI00298C2DFC|nr:uncharacterized protein LOC132870765 [Neoarius graeffei]
MSSTAVLESTQVNCWPWSTCTARLAYHLLQRSTTEDQLVEDIDDEDIEDEGFEEETEDITVPVLTDDDHDIERRPSTTRRRAPSPPPLPELPSTSTGGGQCPVAAAAVPSTSGQGLHPAATAAATSGAQGVVVGPDGIPGWDKVQELAAYLVDLRDAAYLTEPRLRFQQRLKGQEMSTLTQGLTPAPQIPVAPAQLPQPQEKLIVPPASSGQRHEFVFPPNLEGRAPLLRQDRPIAPTPPPVFPLPATLGTSALPVPTPFTLVQLPAMTVPAPPVPFLQLPATTLAASTPGAAPSVPAPPPPAGPPPPPAGPPPPVSRYTERNRRRRATEEASGSAEKRKYVRGATYNMCSQCGKPKTKEYGHSRFGSATFCSQASGGKSVEEWLEEQRAQK